jgi:AcrR family transcriptional regulator
MFTGSCQYVERDGAKSTRGAYFSRKVVAMVQPQGNYEPAGIPEPPWRQQRPARARTPLSRDAIVSAAIEVLDEEGAEALSMRRVAEKLGAGAASLYWHVSSKAALIDLILDRVGAELELPEPDPSRWQEQIKQVMREMRTVLKRHRDLARLSLGRVPVGPNLVRTLEWQLAVMRGAGVPDRVAGLTADLMSLYVGAFAYEEADPAETPTGEEVRHEQMTSMMTGYLRSLPPERFPNILQMVERVMTPGREDRFEFGLDVLVRGLASYEE